MKIDVLGVKINNERKSEVLETIKHRIDNNQKTFIVTPYSESIVAAQKDAELKNILNSADIALPDGIGIPWAAHYLKFGSLIKSLLSIIFNPQFLRNPIPEKISGSDFVWDLARLASENNHSIFLLGGFDNTAELAAKKLKEKFPNLHIAGVAAPVIASDSEAMTNNLVEQINSSQADFLFVALGPVAQEKWIASNLPKLSVKLAIGLGGTFDYLAGNRPLAPQFWRSNGLEWLWRLFTQPWRLWRISKGVLGLIWYALKYKTTFRYN